MRKLLALTLGMALAIFAVSSTVQAQPAIHTDPAPIYGWLYVHPYYYAPHYGPYYGPYYGPGYYPFGGGRGIGPGFRDRDWDDWR
jgi:hypothetical protein